MPMSFAGSSSGGRPAGRSFGRPGGEADVRVEVGPVCGGDGVGLAGHVAVERLIATARVCTLARQPVCVPQSVYERGGGTPCSSKVWSQRPVETPTDCPVGRPTGRFADGVRQHRPSQTRLFPKSGHLGPTGRHATQMRRGGRRKGRRHRRRRA